MGIYQGCLGFCGLSGNRTHAGLLGLDDSARMNKPSSVNGNWIWRMNKSDLTDELAEKIRELTYIYRRC